MTLFDESTIPAPPPRPDLPPLRGSEKQQRWAEDIRTTKLREGYRLIDDRRRLLAVWNEKAAAGGMACADLAEKANRLRESLRFLVGVLEKWEKEDRAWVWIDSRDLSAEQLLAHRG